MGGAGQHQRIVHEIGLRAVLHAVLILNERIAQVVGHSVVFTGLHGCQQHHAHPLVRALVTGQILPLRVVHGGITGNFLDHHAGGLSFAKEQLS